MPVLLTAVRLSVLHTLPAFHGTTVWGCLRAIRMQWGVPAVLPVIVAHCYESPVPLGLSSSYPATSCKKRACLLLPAEAAVPPVARAEHLKLILAFMCRLVPQPVPPVPLGEAIGLPPPPTAREQLLV